MLWCCLLLLTPSRQLRPEHELRSASRATRAHQLSGASVLMSPSSDRDQGLSTDWAAKQRGYTDHTLGDAQR
ncbi:hypothetical protein BDW66DRAFT_124219 [Aspergillus desertorum]